MQKWWLICGDSLDRLSLRLLSRWERNAPFFPCAAALPFFFFGTATHAQTYSDIVDTSASIVGTIQNTSGPSSDIDVTAFRVSIADGMRQAFAACATTTDSDGAYACIGLEPGQYIVQASLKGSIGGGSKTNTTVFTFFPSSSYARLSGRIFVQHGQIQTANVLVESVPLHELRCVLPRNLSEVLGEARIYSTDGIQVNSGSEMHYDPNTGTAVFPGIASGQYELFFRWRVGKLLHYGASTVSVGDSDASIVVSEDLTPVDLRVLLVDSRGKKVSVSSINIGPVTTGHEAYSRFNASISPLAQSDGSYLVHGIIGGVYEMRVTSSPPSYIKAVTVDDDEEEGSLLDISPYNPVHNVIAYVNEGLSGINGVVGGAYISGERAIVAAEDVHGVVSTTRTNKSGEFTIGDLPPGEYRLYSWKAADEIAYRGSKDLADVRPGPVEVQVKTGSPEPYVYLSLVDK